MSGPRIMTVYGTRPEVGKQARCVGAGERRSAVGFRLLCEGCGACQVAGETHAPGRRPDLRKRVERAQQT